MQTFIYSFILQMLQLFWNSCLCHRTPRKWKITYLYRVNSTRFSLFFFFSHFSHFSSFSCLFLARHVTLLCKQYNERSLKMQRKFWRGVIFFYYAFAYILRLECEKQWEKMQNKPKNGTIEYLYHKFIWRLRYSAQINSWWNS